MKKLFFLFIFLLFFCSIVTSAEKINDLEVEWSDFSKYTISWTSPTITKSGYVIKVIDFDWKGNAAVSVTKNGITQNGIISQQENQIFNYTRNTSYFEGLKIYPTKISHYSLPINIGTYPCCPAAEIEVRFSQAIIKKEPSLKLILDTKWDGRLGHTSEMKLEIRNTGKTFFSDGNVLINISGLEIADMDRLSKQAITFIPGNETVIRRWYTPLFANNSFNLTIPVKIPFPSNKSSYNINVYSIFNDSSGKMYPATLSSTVQVKPAVRISKTTTSSAIIGDNSEDFERLLGLVGLGKVIAVNIYLENLQSFNLNSLILNDTIHEDFVLINDSISNVSGFSLMDNNTKLQWIFNLNSSKKREFRYLITPRKTGTFRAPAATAEWTKFDKKNTISSGRPSTRVHGIFLIVSKKTDKTSFTLNDTLNISVDLQNIGDFPIGINATDILPLNSTFVSGTTTFTGYLRPMEIVSIVYNVSANNTGELELSSPDVSFWKEEYEGSYIFIPSQNIKVEEPKIELSLNESNVTQTALPTPAVTLPPKSLLDVVSEKAPWLEGAIPIVMLLVAIILLLMLHIVNR